MSTPDRFWAKVDKTEECWLWTGVVKAARGGYGYFRVNASMARAHRYAYALVIGPIPDEHDLDHLCQTPACVRPDHLEPVSRSENLRRAAASRALADSCAQGHPFDETNTFTRKDGARGCRACRNNASRVSKARARAARAATQPSQTGNDLAHERNIA